ncbi:probable calcium-binding protein CML47 [Durio zibethinus]|uniref:Probable calcium-binding protein CML47 n=1 Tax=Durio zibethinus TaxID=66656 RepID=A0A6P5ZSF9_DURZI|nr:probable calcium-binding protein CML47 [Durio zibethinus]
MDAHMDAQLTTICSSSSAFHIEMENTVMKQVWSHGCYSLISRESRTKIGIPSPPSVSVNGSTTKRKIEKSSSTELIPLCGIIVSLVILNLVIILQDFYSSFHCVVSIFKSFLRILSCISNTCAATTTAKRRSVEIKPPRNQTETDDRNLPLLEVKKVIQGALWDLESYRTEKSLGADKIGGLFEEEEPSLEEVKEAFDVFDENKDGFIDAKELGNVMFSLGFMQASEDECKRMIKGFDDNFDGRIDLTEFIKVMERSLF